MKRDIRLGEIKNMNNMLKAKIIEYNNSSDIFVLFIDTDEIVHTTYNHFKNGNVKSIYGKKVLGVGILDDTCVNDEKNVLRSYGIWHSMLQRCYSIKFLDKHPTYKGCTVCDEWLFYGNFKKWYNENYYKINDEIICLDKDILYKGNRIYSPDTCVFTPQRINSLFTKRQNHRGDFPIGVYYNKRVCQFVALCKDINLEQVNLGKYNTEIEAFIAYKKFKERTIKKVANKYKKNIPDKLYSAMYKYKVELAD